MKHLILAIAFIAATFTSAFADRLTDNAAAIEAGNTLLAAKITALQSNLNSHNAQAAQTAATDILDLMRKGMVLTNDRMNLESKDQQKAINKHYLEMERLAHEYQGLSTNVAANGPQLVRHAQNFLKEY
jgi:hypothetical protein